MAFTCKIKGKARLTHLILQVLQGFTGPISILAVWAYIVGMEVQKQFSKGNSFQKIINQKLKLEPNAGFLALSCFHSSYYPKG